MFLIQKILKDNNISIFEICKILNILSSSTLYCKLTKKRDFSIDDLNTIKDFLIKKEIINNDFDIGNFLNEI